jgi:dTDP-4-amino-4,6-dideoxy-D-galactose acyltransferase
MSSNNPEPCELLEWDTAFWGFTVARVRGNRLDHDKLSAIDAWCARFDVRCLYLLAAADDFATTCLAENAQFRLVDVRMTYARRTNEGLAPRASAATPLELRSAADGDIVALQQIARASYQDTRFYHDPRFKRDRCDDLYATWIERSCHGYADAVLVAGPAGEADGYVTCHGHRPDSPASIGLVGVRPDARGRGVASTLVAAAIDWFRAAGEHDVTVVTQARNLQAQRLYQRAGFSLVDVGLWFHRWYPASAQTVPIQ